MYLNILKPTVVMNARSRRLECNLEKQLASNAVISYKVTNYNQNNISTSTSHKIYSFPCLFSSILYCFDHMEVDLFRIYLVLQITPFNPSCRGSRKCVLPKQQVQAYFIARVGYSDGDGCVGLEGRGRAGRVDFMVQSVVVSSLNCSAQTTTNVCQW